MAALFRWDSELLKQYSVGDLIAMAETPDEARAMLRAELDGWLKENRTWEWAEATGEWGGEIDTAPLDRLRALFEADIAKEPDVCTTLWLNGSE